MSRFTPWTKEQAEQWCKPDRHPRFGNIYDLSARELYRAAYRDGWRAAFAKAAEMIEAQIYPLREKAAQADLYFDQVKTFEHVHDRLLAKAKNLSSAFLILEECILKESHRCGIWRDGEAALEKANIAKRGLGPYEKD